MKRIKCASKRLILVYIYRSIYMESNFIKFIKTKINANSTSFGLNVSPQSLFWSRVITKIYPHFNFKLNQNNIT